MTKTVIGLTGGIACGKSTVTDYLIKNHYDVCDADKLAHSAYSEASLAYNQILDVFGTLDRKTIGSIVFSDQEKRKQLEAIIHPYVLEMTKRHIEESKDLLVFLDVPLLFEAHFDVLCDKIICVSCNSEIQLERLMKRNGFSKEEAMKRIASQMSLEDKMKQSDYIIMNDGNLEMLYKRIDEVLKEVKEDESI